MDVSSVPVVEGADFLIKVLQPMTVLPRDKKAPKEPVPGAEPADAGLAASSPSAPPAAPPAAPAPVGPPAPSSAGQEGRAAAAPPVSPVAPPAAPPAPAAPAAAFEAGPGAAEAPEDQLWAPAPEVDHEPQDDDEPVVVASRPIWILPLLGAVGVLGLGAIVLLGVGVIGVSTSGGSGGDKPNTPAVVAPPIEPPPIAPPPIEPPPGDAAATPSGDAPTEATDASPPDTVADVTPEPPAGGPATADPVAPIVPVAPVEPPKPVVVGVVPPKDKPPVVTPPGPGVQPWGETPAAKVGTLVVKTTPPGATVKVGGKTGTSPFTVELPLGGHDVVAELKGHTGVTKRVEVTAGSMQLPLELKAVAAATPPPADTPPARTGAVMVFSAGRDGDELFVDGKSMGRLPGRITITEGKHTFKVVGAKGDFESQKDVAFSAAGTAVVTLTAP